MGQEKPSTVVLLITKFAYRYMYFCNFLLFWRFNRHAITITHIYFTNIYYVVVVVIPVTRRVRCYTRFIEKYVIGRRQSFHHMKPIYSRSGSISESIWRCPSVCMNVEISGTIQSRRLRLSIQILEKYPQRKFVGLCCHAHKSSKTATFFHIFISFLNFDWFPKNFIHQYLSISQTNHEISLWHFN